MKTLYAFFLFWSFQASAQTSSICLEVKNQTNVVRHSDKSRVPISAGYRFKPLKRNKSKTYILIKIEDDKHWIKQTDVSLKRNVDCQNNSLYVDGVLSEKTLDLETVSEDNTINTDIAVQKEKVKSSSEHFAPIRVRGLRFHVGTAVAGSNIKGKGLHTKIEDVNSVQQEQNPLFVSSEFSSMMEAGLSYQWRSFGQFRMQSTLGFRSSKVITTALRNPVDNSGIPVSINDLTEKSEVEFTDSSVFFNLTLGRQLWSKGNLKFLLHFGLSTEYSLEGENIQSVLFCGTESCPLKATTKNVRGQFDQIMFSPVVGLDLQYRWLLIGANIDLNYTPTFKLGVIF